MRFVDHPVVRVVLVAALLSGGMPRPAAAAPGMSLPDCVGKPQVRPSQVVFACGDGNFYARKLQWTGWGEPFAAAVGAAEVNDCTPYCAAGKFHSYRVMLVATGRQTCPDGRLAYSTVEYAFVGKSPMPAAQNTTARFPCGPRK
jgi:hypothetical protein